MIDKILEWIHSINVESLLKFFDSQMAIGLFLFFTIFRGVFSRLVIRFYYMVIKKDKSPKESSMYKPLNIFFVLLGIFCMINMLPTNQKALDIMNQIFSVVVIFYITKAVSTLLTVDSFFAKKYFKNSKNPAVDKFICNILRVCLWIIAALVAATILGFDLSVFSGLVAGLGIASAGAALAAQDIVKSMLSGVAILSDKPFVIGDWIEVDKFQGTVIDITFRSTRIKSYNNAVVTIPNSTITSNYVVNWNRLTSRRFDCILNLSLDTPSDKIKKIVKEIKVMLQNDPKVIKETVEVTLNEISTSSCDIKIFLYVREAEYAKFLHAKQDILCNLLFLFEKENVELAYPTQTLFVKRKEDVVV